MEELEKVTEALLSRYIVCPGQAKLFRKTFPTGATPSPATLRKAARVGLSVSWWAERFLPSQFRDEYRRLVYPLRAEFAHQEAPFWAEYRRQEAPLWAEYERQRALLWAEYERQRALLWAEYEQQVAPLRAKYERQVAEVIIGLLWPGKEKK